jgi:Protein of unknown function with HXXEE motif
MRSPQSDTRRESPGGNQWEARALLATTAFIATNHADRQRQSISRRATHCTGASASSYNFDVGSSVYGRVGFRRFDGVWLFPPTYVIHLTEEYLAAGGFPLWADRTLAIRFSNAEFTAWSTLALGLTCLGAWLVSRDSRFRFIEIALAIAVLGNVAMHVFASLLTWTYSPGLVSGVLIWIPLGAARLRSARRTSTRRGYIAGVYLGLSVVLITMAVVVVSARLS